MRLATEAWWYARVNETHDWGHALVHETHDSGHALVHETHGSVSREMRYWVDRTDCSRDGLVDETHGWGYVLVISSLLKIWEKCCLNKSKQKSDHKVMDRKQGHVTKTGTKRTHALTKQQKKERQRQKHKNIHTKSSNRLRWRHCDKQNVSKTLDGMCTISWVHGLCPWNAAS